jgi:acetate kinase
VTGTILTLNAGSSSLKFALFDAAGPLALSASMRGEIEDLQAAPYMIARGADGAVIAERHWPAELPDLFDVVLRALLAFAEALPGARSLAAVGHRVVHGGADHIAPERVTPALMCALHALIPLDPLHMPHCLAPIAAVSAARPDLVQVVCFDTAFHSTMPPVAKHLALPRALSEAGVRRYGFHGLSYDYIAGRLPAVSPRLAQGRVITAHLGAGASLCAMQAGRSIETTMGFSVLDGLMMATRCGSVDAGVLLYLARQGRSVPEIEDMLYRRSGLLGVSDVRAAEALDLFSYRIAAAIGALTAALGGLDGIIFTAGIGEHAAPVRAAVCQRLAWLGVVIDAEANEVGANEAGAGLISRPDSPIEVRIIPTDEEVIIAHHVSCCM